MKTIRLYKTTEYALIDDDLYDTVIGFGKGNWQLDSQGYVRIQIGRKPFFMHHFALSKKTGFDVDHIDRNRLNNQRSNLRYLEHYKNCANRGPNINNTSGYKGVTLMNGRWIAVLRVKSVKIHIGSFSTPEKAAQAYNEKAKLHIGEGAYLNPV